MQMEQYILDSGKTINSMDLVRNPGQMELAMKDNTVTEKRMGKES